ncbi:MAG TPA: ornithine racemase Orr [Ignavibacteriales bacterium]|nr:ornithine racemase Orr [Ignavibacteriales bacterium]
MKYPALIIDRNKLFTNAKNIIDTCHNQNISVSAVTKVFCGSPDIADIILQAKPDYIADSRIENLIKLKHFNLPKVLLRIPMISQVDDVAQNVDICLISELETIFKLNDAAYKINKVQNIILMIDLGDLREGIWFKNFKEYIEPIFKLKQINVIGIGVNLTCYGGVIPKENNLSQLLEYADFMKNKYDAKLDIISGGNSSSLYLVYENRLPKGINNLRLGESIVLGRETAFGNQVLNTYDDAFKLVAEIVELKEKPSVPIGEIGMDAFGNKPTFIDKGIIKRAILAIGKQDITLDGIIPYDDKIEILGGSSDHLILNVSNSDKNYKVGDIVEFKLTYGGLLAASTSNYVEKIIV